MKGDVAQQERRLSARTRLGRPVEAQVLLCRGARCKGWVLDESEGGVGMRFTEADAEILTAHEDCCTGELVRFTLLVPGYGRLPLPVRIAWAMKGGASHREVRAGLQFERAKMSAEQVRQLLALWTAVGTAARS